MLKLRNSYTNAVEPFVPLDPKGRDVTFYACGPTVYSYAHIGNFRTFLMADLLRRTLERRGYNVRQVMNITDVGHLTEDHLADATGEDKLSKTGREFGWDPRQVAAHFEDAFVADAIKLRMRNYSGEAEREGADANDRALHPRATDFVPEMLAMIQRLVERDYAYVDSAGQVYFDISRFPEYGRLSGKVLDDLVDGARVEVRDEKRNPRDFALWKVDAKHLMQWNPHSAEGWLDDGFSRLTRLVPTGVDERIGAGFPGWHIECSAMSHACLGPLIDVHTGGEDNVFPHHECEIAQSYGARTDEDAPKSFAKFWVHGRHLMVNGAKMSKRDGTFFTPRELFDPALCEREAPARKTLFDELSALGFPGAKVPPAVLRCALVSVPYTQPMNFTLAGLVQAKASVERLQSLYDRLREHCEASEGDGDRDGDAASGGSDESDEFTRRVAQREAAFDEALDDNLNVSRALAALFGFVSDCNAATLSAADAQVALTFLRGADDIFDVLDRGARSGIITSEQLDAAAPPPAEALDSLLDGELGEPALLRLLALRAAARRSRDFATADRVRDGIRDAGFDLDDVPQGIRWKRRT